jgi:hypothetical protein
MPNIDFQSFIFGIPVGGVAGYLIKEFIGNFLAKGRAKQDRLADIRNVAAIRFKEAFVDIKLLLNPKSFAVDTNTKASDAIKDAIVGHEIAMANFEPFVPDSDINKFKLAWNEYAGESKHFEQYSSDNMFENKKRKDLALSRIEKLLSFAKKIH